MIRRFARWRITDKCFIVQTVEVCFMDLSFFPLNTKQLKSDGCSTTPQHEVNIL